MSFFNKLFGGEEKEKKEKKVAQKPQVQTVDAKMLKIQAACASLDKKIDTFMDGEKKYEHKIDIYKEQAKALLEAGKKKEARVKMQEATRIQKQLDGYRLRRKALMDKKFQLQQAKMDVAAIDAIDEAQNHMKDVGVQKYSEKVEDLILDAQETKMQQQQINDRLKDLVQNDEEEQEIDDMMNELMGEIQTEKKKKIEANKVNPNVPQTNTVKQKKVQEQDDIAKMMAELG